MISPSKATFDRKNPGKKVCGREIFPSRSTMGSYTLCRRIRSDNDQHGCRRSMPPTARP
jgi:hypothetical protein